MGRTKGSTVKKIAVKDSTKSLKSSAIADIRVVGIGGAGGNAVNFMINNGLHDIKAIVMNTDVQDLDKSKADYKVQLGEKVTKGLGAGANPELGKQGAEEDKINIKAAIEGADLLFITAGMGGGTGTGAAPVVAQIAREMGILTVAVVTRPFSFEGLKRTQNCIAGINNLAKYVDTLVVIPNEKLFDLPTKDISLKDAFEAANGILEIGIKSISDLITQQGYINLDFADVKSIMSSSGFAMLGFGYAEGEGRARIATEQAIYSPLLERPINGARKILLNITGNEDVGLAEASEIANLVSKASGDAVSDIIFGSVMDPKVKGIKVTVIATDFVDRPNNMIGSAIANSKVEILNIPAFLRRNKR